MGLLKPRLTPIKFLAKQLYIAALLILASLATGVVGFMAIEHYTFIEAFFMTIITISTVGYGEVRHLSDAGRMFTAFYIITNIGIFTYAVSSVIALVVQGRFREAYNYLRLENNLDHLQNHTIICGLGRNGLKTCQEMAEFHHPFVAIESNDVQAKLIAKQYGFTVLTGDATDDDLLLKAGILRAKSLITTLPNDAANVYVVLTAKGLNPNLQIISRASSDTVEKKLLKAGANQVVIPEKIGGSHMAKMVLAPHNLVLLEDLYKFGGKEISFREVAIEQVASQHRSQSVGALIDKKTQTMVVGVKTASGNYILNPKHDIAMNDVVSLLLMGDDKHLQEFEQLIKKKLTLMPPKKILGVCAWLSVRLDLDVSIIRIIFTVAIILGLGSPILLYLILYLIARPEI